MAAAIPSHSRRRIGGIQWLGILLATIVLGTLAAHSLAAPSSDADTSGGHAAPGLLSIFPFAGLLLCIAILPLIPATAHWWERNRNRLLVALSFGAMTLSYYFVTRGSHHVVHVLEHALFDEYIPFMTLLFSLYVISGGIRLTGDLPAHPITNTAFLAGGGLIASFVGTTGASMLLIRALLQTNSERHRVRHTVIFFIFIVSNCGGCLLPIGDPPLFLGYLKGVSFLWTLTLWPEWLCVNLALLVIYFIWDTRAYRHEVVRDIVLDETQRQPLRLSGGINFVWLLGVVLCVAMIEPGQPVPIVGITAFPYFRELLMFAFSGLSAMTTSRAIREGNQFNYHAILEVAALFIGIFICMQAPIALLNANGPALEPILSSPIRFFWATGTLSGFLDNAPTYVVFFETAAGMSIPQGVATVPFSGGLISEATLAAISLGSVFMGSMTYIGNGPNFMVKSIAEQSGVKMPGFFGYMVYSCCILLPLFALVSLAFLH